MMNTAPSPASSRFHQNDGLSYLTFRSLEELGVIHGVFSRQGGTSPTPWASLNMGATVGDEIDNVRENRRRAMTALGRDPASSHDTWLVHGTTVVYADAPRPADTQPQKADVVLTDRPEVTLFMRFADCTPILLVDPLRKAAGLAHAGWMGTVQKVAGVAVRAMQERYGSRPADIRAVVGPAICVEHYPVGPEVVAQVRTSFGEQANQVLFSQGDKTCFDLWNANRLVLEEAGVAQVSLSGICTACDTQHWYSHRAEHGQTGRFGALLALPA